MQLSNYSEEYIKERADDFQDFVESMDEYVGLNVYSMQTLAVLYTVMKLEIPRENSGYSGY